MNKNEMIIELNKYDVQIIQRHGGFRRDLGGNGLKYYLPFYAISEKTQIKILNTIYLNMCKINPSEELGTFIEKIKVMDSQIKNIIYGGEPVPVKEKNNE